LEVPETLAKTWVESSPVSPTLPVNALIVIGTVDTGELSTQVFASVSGTSKTENGVMLEVEDYGMVDPSQVVRFKN
jgi:hypothetical protein